MFINNSASTGAVMDFDVRLSNTINYTPMNLYPIGTQAFQVLQWLPIQKLSLILLFLFNKVV